MPVAGRRDSRSLAGAFVPQGVIPCLLHGREPTLAEFESTDRSQPFAVLA